MTIPNKEIIQAYLDGKTIQYKLSNLEWRDFTLEDHYDDVVQPNPIGNKSIPWRIKPTQAELDYQRFLNLPREDCSGPLAEKAAYMQGWIDGNLASKRVDSQ